MESAIQPSCLECVERPEHRFCDLPDEALHDFDLLKTFTVLPKGTMLFRTGEPAHNVMVLCEGRVRLSVCSESGRRLTLRIAGPGEVLGLSAVLAGSPYQMTAELLDNAQVASIRRKDLLRFLHEHREACLQVVNLLSQDLHVAYDRVRSIGLARSRRSRVPRVH